jgi:hypothetical protein
VGDQPTSDRDDRLRLQGRKLQALLQEAQDIRARASVGQCKDPEGDARRLKEIQALHRELSRGYQSDLSDTLLQVLPQLKDQPPPKA